MAHIELNLRERRVIEDMLNAKIPLREITSEIGRQVSTIYRDIKRNGYTDEEFSCMLRIHCQAAGKPEIMNTDSI